MNRTLKVRPDTRAKIDAIHAQRPRWSLVEVIDAMADEYIERHPECAPAKQRTNTTSSGGRSS